MKNQRQSAACRTLAIFVFGLAIAADPHRVEAAPTCKKVILKGEVNAGQIWKARLGQGWEFRLHPIQPGQAGYSGWDLVVDREQSTGYPDALLLATPPFNSITEREIGTTFGLRAQDAIGWNPRIFHFLIDPEGFHAAQKAFLALEGSGQLNGSAQKTAAAARDMGHLMQLERHKASGEVRIEDSRVTPGISDAATFAQAWALAGMRAQHQIVPAPGGKSSPRGAFLWIRFTAALWLPASWKLPAGLEGISAACVP